MGANLEYHGCPCVVDGILLTEHYKQVKLNFQVCRGQKLGVDGWYDMSKLQNDMRVYIISYTESVSHAIKHERGIWYGIGDIVSYRDKEYKVGAIKMLIDGEWILLQKDNNTVSMWKRAELVKSVKNNELECDKISSVNAIS